MDIIIKYSIFRTRTKLDRIVDRTKQKILRSINNSSLKSVCN